MSRITRSFGVREPPCYPAVTVRGPHNSKSPKWTLDMTHSSLALYWQDSPARAREELDAIREALAFIERQVLTEAVEL